MQRSRLIELLAKKKSGGISLKEQFELSKWLQENGDDRALAGQIDELFALEYGPQQTDDDLRDREKSWSRIRKAMDAADGDGQLPPKQPRSFIWRRFLPFSVASVVVLSVGTYYWMNAGKNAPRSENIVGTEKGSRSKLTLPDGSKVWLNGDSRISYGASFGKNDRELTLIGEAYFDVAKDPHHPMIIKTATVTIKVLGTAFNVRAYPDESTTATTLVEGKVQVSVNHKKALSYELQPDEKLIVQNISGLPEVPVNKQQKEELLENITKIKIVRTDTMPSEAQWTRNKLVFIDQPLQEVAGIISRWYGVNVIVQGGESFKAQKYTGIYENKSIQSVMESLQVAGGLRYQLKNDTIFIAP